MSNQFVLIANWGKFPVMINEKEIAELQTPPEIIDNGSIDILIPGNQFSILNTAVLFHSKTQTIDTNDQFIDEYHSIMGKNSHLKFLADYIKFPDGIYSPGDMLVLLGFWILSFSCYMWLALVIRKLAICCL